jgi:hypothetical protein
LEKYIKHKGLGAGLSGAAPAYYAQGPKFKPTVAKEKKSLLKNERKTKIFFF